MSFGIPVRNGLAIGLLSSTTLSSNGGLFPAMALDFLQPFLDSRITFSRGSNATLVDATGKITYAPNNLLYGSKDLTSSSWTKTAGSAAVVTSAAPDGTNATSFTPDTTNSIHRVVGNIGATVSPGNGFVSFYLKSNGVRYVYINCNAATGVQTAVDLQTGSTVTAAGTNVTAVSVGNGWWQVSAKGVGATTTQLFLQANTSLVAADQTYIGDGTSSFLFWQGSVSRVTYETAPRQTDMVATIDFSAYYGPRFDYDPVTLAAKGLLIEEQRVNLQTYSEQIENAVYVKTACTISTNSTLSPAGTQTADTIVENTANTTHFVYAPVTITGGATTTFTVFLKSAGRNAQVRIQSNNGTFSYVLVNVNLTSGAQIGSTVSSGATAIAFDTTPYGNGWFRVRITAALTADVTSAAGYVFTYNNTESYLGDGVSGVYAWGWQLEAGAFATSYIPTVASTVTRSADVATMTGTNFSSWYNQSEGTLLSNATFIGRPATVGNARTAVISDGTGDNLISAGLRNNANSPGMYYGQVNTGGTTQAILPSPIASDIGDNVIFRSVIAYKVNDIAMTANGATVSTDTSATIPTVNRMVIGGFEGTSNFVNGHIRQIAYYNTRLPNSQLQTLTAPSLGTTLSLSFTNQAYTVGV
jgi:hypothetical protein